MGERAEELVDEAGVVGRLEGGRGEEDGVEGEVRRPREFLTERSLAVAAQGAGGGVGVDPRGGLAHHLRTPLRGVEEQVGARERRGLRSGGISRARRGAAVAGMRQWGDEEIEARVQGLPQATLQVMAHVHLEAGVVAIPEVGASSERHPDRDGTSTRATRSRPTLPPLAPILFRPARCCCSFGTNAWSSA